MCTGTSSGASKDSKDSKDTALPLIIGGEVHLPFQLQVKYTDLDGSRCMRVTTMAKPITDSKQTANRSELLVRQIHNEYMYVN